MIIDWKRQFVIVTSSKCGTHSLEAACKSTGFAYRSLPRHSAKVDLEIPIRILIVRDPYDRFASMWFHQLYMDADYNVKERDIGFEAWTAKFFDDRDSGKQNVWVNNLSDQHRIMQATHFFKMESQALLWKFLSQYCEVPKREHRAYVNKNRERQAPYHELTPETRARLDAWCASDTLLLQRAT